MTDFTPQPRGTELAFQTILQAAREQDSEAQQQLFQRFYGRVERMVHLGLMREQRGKRPWLISRFSTGDVVQEVFRSVLTDLDGFAGTTEEAFAGYLAIVIRNRILDAVRFHEAARRDSRRTGDGSAVPNSESKSQSPQEEAIGRESAARLVAAIGRFPERERLLLRARFEGTDSIASLAEKLGYSSASACQRAYYSAQARLALLLREPIQ